MLQSRVCFDGSGLRGKPEQISFNVAINTKIYSKCLKNVYLIYYIKFKLCFVNIIRLQSVYFGEG